MLVLIQDWYLELELCQKIHISWILVILANLLSKKNASLHFCSHCTQVLIVPYPLHIVGLFHLSMHDSGNWYNLVCTSLITSKGYPYVCLRAIWIFQFSIHNIWSLFLNLSLKVLYISWILTIFGCMVEFHLSFFIQILPDIFFKK